MPNSIKTLALFCYIKRDCIRNFFQPKNRKNIKQRYFTIKSAIIQTIIVTYNRKQLLVECIKALLNQTTFPKKILIIDNASTDGTESYLKSQGFLDHPLTKYHRLPENLGGAGGFAEGMKLALQSEADWMWLMDDDALPAHDALEKLQQYPLKEDCVYGSVAICDDGERLCWPVETITAKKLNTISDLNAPKIPVLFHPFLGFLISRQLIEKAGLPDRGFFLSGDDVDYCLRIASLGGKVYLCRDSKLTHPMPPRKSIKFLGLKIDLLIQAPERTYYNIRNKIIIARRYYGHKLWTQTMPGIAARLFLCLIYRPVRIDMLKVYLIAIAHGFMGRMGKFNVDE